MGAGRIVQPQLGREIVYLEVFQADVEIEYVIGGTTIEDLTTTITQARVCWDDREMDAIEIDVFNLVELVQKKIDKRAAELAA